MTTISSASLAQDIVQTQQSSTKLAQDFDDFLILLTTQLQNQDPLSPMDSTEFTNQLVGFSQVEQQINMNQKFEEMLGLQLSSMSTVALNYVGMNVSFLGNQSFFDGEKPLDIEYRLANEATFSKMRVINEEGETVRTLDLEKAPGIHAVSWDGLDDQGDVVAAGTYDFVIDALDQEENVVPSDMSVPGHVVGIDSSGGVSQLLLEGERVIPVASVISAQQRV
jgi:flagellar basal-body rod modification protein FlgD